MARICNLWLILAVALSFAACSARTPAAPVITEWRKPDMSATFGRVMVAGPSSSATLRRNFEDEFLSQLHAAGVNAVASYRYIAESDTANLAVLSDAARQARADALIVVRSVQTEQKSQTSGGYAPGLSLGVFGSHVGASWHGLGGGPSVSRYQEQVSETALYDVAKNDLVWTGTVRTGDAETAPFAAKSHVEAVLRALDTNRLVRRGQ
jgi:hypothetical protein